MDHAEVEVNGIRLHYVTVGRGPLILFVHGFPEFWYEWRKQLVEFGRDHQAVAPDMRGYNLSGKPAELSQYRVPHMVEDLRALADHLCRQKFVPVGHDWGGAVAWALAMAPPARRTAPLPTLLIGAARDQALRTGTLDGLERFVPDLTIERISDGSHWVVHEHPERVNRLIRDFLGPRRPPAETRPHI